MNSGISQVHIFTQSGAPAGPRKRRPLWWWLLRRAKYYVSLSGESAVIAARAFVACPPTYLPISCVSFLPAKKGIFFLPTFTKFWIFVTFNKTELILKFFYYSSSVLGQGNLMLPLMDPWVCAWKIKWINCCEWERIYLVLGKVLRDH